MINWSIHWILFQLAPEALSWREIPGYVGSLLVLLSFLTRTMIRLRALSAGANVFIIAYAILVPQYPTLALNAALLPLNIVRLVQMVRLVRRVRTAAGGSRAMDWLKPYMTRRHFRRGQTLFRKGDRGDRLYYVASGCFQIPELGIRLMPGEFVGELGLLEPEGLRTQSLECAEDGDVLAITYDQVHELFFQNPDFGFYFMRLAAGRLFNSLRTLEQTLSQPQKGAGVAAAAVQDVP